MFVRAGHTFAFDKPQREGTLYRWPGLVVTNSIGVPLGVAADALDTATGILAGTILMPQRTPARDEARVRVAIARAQAMVGSARSYAYDTLGRFWSVLESGDQPGFTARAAVAGCLVHTVTTCREAVQRAPGSASTEHGPSAVTRICL